MEVQAKIADKRKSFSDFEDDEETSSGVAGERGGSTSMSKTHLEQDKRVRREIANSNERRRMQSINAGFQSLRCLIPHHDGEKMSKAGILQQSAEYINTLESEKTRLLTQNAQLKQIIRETTSRSATASSSTDSDSSSNGSPPPKRKKRDTESSDEGISMGFDDPAQEDLKREMLELRKQLDRERRMRLRLEEERRALQARLQPERPHRTNTPSAPAPTPTPIPAPTPAVEERPMKAVQTQSEPRVPVKQQPSGADVQRPSPEPIRSAAEPRPAPLLSSSMSRRNLETIVEAIRHLEGDAMLADQHSRPSHPPSSHHIPQSEESAEEGCKSDSSGRDSPLCLAMDSRSRQHSAITTTAATATLVPVHTQPPQVIATADKYPIAMHLLHPNQHQHPAVPGVLAPPQFIHRPAVIVQKSS